jgi:hypothetical protein
MIDLRDKIERLLQEAAECDMLGRLAAEHDERAANRKRAEELSLAIVFL